MKTIRDGKWLSESGPNSALETTPLFKELFRDLGIESELRYSNEAGAKRYIVRNRKLHALPTSPGSFVGSSLWSLSGKLRLLKEPFVGKAQHEPV